MCGYGLKEWIRTPSSTGCRTPSGVTSHSASIWISFQRWVALVRCLRLWGPRFEAGIQLMKQIVAHNGHLPCCQCTEPCSQREMRISVGLSKFNVSHNNGVCRMAHAGATVPVHLCNESSLCHIFEDRVKSTWNISVVIFCKHIHQVIA